MARNIPERVPTNDEIKNLDGVEYTVIHGNKYLCSPLAYSTSEVHEIVRNLPLRDDDVWMVGYPKSGNHWALEVVTMILHQNTEFAEKPFRDHCTEYLGLDVQEQVEGFQTPRVFGSHLHYPENYPKEVFEKKLKILYLLRNPKDVFVSAYHMFSTFTAPQLHYTKSFDECFDLQIKGEFIFGDWFDHVLSIEKFMNSHPEHPVYVHCYEHMKEDPVSAIEKLCAFFGKPTDLAADIAKATDFNHMKTALNAGKMKDFNQAFINVKPEEGVMFRKGVIGDWKNTLSPEQSAQIKKVFDEKMSGSKLGALVRKYM